LIAAISARKSTDRHVADEERGKTPMSTSSSPPLDERQLDLIRAFLHRNFLSSETVDTFDAERSAQRFIVNPNGPDRHTLIAMRDALDHPDLELLLDERLIDALRLAGVSPVTLTAQGPTY
jgi:hypothetical protein